MVLAEWSGRVCITTTASDEMHFISELFHELHMAHTSQPGAHPKPWCQWQVRCFTITGTIPAKPTAPSHTTPTLNHRMKMEDPCGRHDHAVRRRATSDPDLCRGDQVANHHPNVVPVRALCPHVRPERNLRPSDQRREIEYDDVSNSER